MAAMKAVRRHDIRGCVGLLAVLLAFARPPSLLGRSTRTQGKCVYLHVEKAREFCAEEAGQRPCIIYRQNHYGFVWNIVHTIEFAVYHARDADIYIDYSTNDYQCPGHEYQSWWHWLDSSVVRPLSAAPREGCAIVAYSGDKAAQPDRFVDWVLLTRDRFRERTGLKDLQITFGPVSPAQQVVREGLMEEVGYTEAALEDVVQRLWVPSGELATLVEYEWGLLDRLRKPLVVVHVRGGDKHKENVAMWDAQTAEAMRNTASGIRKLAAAHTGAQGGTCVIVGDGWEHARSAAATAEKELGCDIVNQVYPRTDYSRDSFMAGTVDRCLGGTHVFVMIELMGRANFTVGSLHNAPYQAASFVRHYKYGHPLSTCVDNADFGQPAFLY